MMNSFSSSSNHTMTDFELKMKVQVKEIRSLVSRHGAKVPSTFTLWNPPSGYGSNSNQVSNNGTHIGGTTNGVVEDLNEKNLQLFFLCMEEPISESTLFAATIPTHGKLLFNFSIGSIFNLFFCV